MHCKINQKLLLIKIHYFLINGALSATVPYLPVYAKQLGLSALAVGVIYTLLSFLILVAKPLFGAVADRFQNLKRLLAFFIVLTAASMLSMNFIPKKVEQDYDNDNSTVNCLQNGTSFIIHDQDSCISRTSNKYTCSLFCFHCERQLCESSLNSSKDLKTYLQNHSKDHEISLRVKSTALNGNCSSISNLYCNVLCARTENICSFEDDETIRLTLQFWLFTFLIITAWVAYGVSVTLSDTACYSMLKHEVHLYGKQRLWGTIGWGSFAAITGYLNNFSKLPGSYNYSPGFYVLTGLLMIDLVVINRLEISKDKMRKNVLKNVGRLLAEPKVLLFLIGVFIVGVCTGLVRSYLFWYLRTLNASQLLLGLATGFQCFLGELPFFFLAGWIIRKIGHIYSVSFIFLSYAARFFFYSYLKDPWWVLPIEILQGPGTGLFYSTMTSYAKLNAPPGSEATMQGLLGGTFEGLGVATGSLLGGVTFGLVGGRNTFFWSSIAVCCIFFLYLIAQKTMGNETKSLATEPKKDKDESELACL